MIDVLLRYKGRDDYYNVLEPVFRCKCFIINVIYLEDIVNRKRRCIVTYYKFVQSNHIAQSLHEQNM